MADVMTVIPCHKCNRKNKEYCTVNGFLLPGERYSNPQIKSAKIVHFRTHKKEIQSAGKCHHKKQIYREKSNIKKEVPKKSGNIQQKSVDFAKKCDIKKGVVQDMVSEKPIRCICGKLIAIERDGKIYIKCRGCKHEVELPIQRMDKNYT